MALSADHYLQQLKQLLPRGLAWSRDVTSIWHKLLSGLADEMARVDGVAWALLDEADPRRASALLEQWERVAGLPDACTLTIAGVQTIEQRRAALLAQLSGTGGQTPAFYVALAASLGYVVTVTEFAPYDVDDNVDLPIYGNEWAFAWQINAPLVTLTQSTVDSDVDMPLAVWGNAALECLINRYKPAHSTALYSYS